MRNNLLILGGLVLAAIAGGYFLRPAPTAIIDLSNPVETLDKQLAPSISFKDLSDKSYTLQDFKGRVVVLNFWASWCAPCIIEMPQLLELARNNPKNMTLILMSVDADKKALTGFFNKHGLELPDNTVIVWDKDKKISKDVFGTIRYPESIVIDREGVMVRKYPGAVEWNEFLIEDIGNE